MTPVTSNSSPISATPAAPVSPNSNQALTSKDTFLKLLVAQIQNQDPTSPQDPTQFVSQLTQYSELEQLIQINTGIASLTPSAAAASVAAAGRGTQPVAKP